MSYIQTPKPHQAMLATLLALLMLTLPWLEATRLDQVLGPLPQSGLTQSALAAPLAATGPLQNIVAVSAGGVHTCALNTSGGVQCWGGNTEGQLGDNTVEQRLMPTAVSGLASGVAMISAGYGHTCAVTSDGGALCWGDNNGAQIGDNTVEDRLVPTAPTTLSSGVAAISSGAFHTCALTTGGGVKCWGVNDVGQLGADTTPNAFSLTPVDVTSLTSGVSTIAVGYFHSCALTSGGGVKCWGSNQFGQLGVTETITRSITPVDVTNLTSGVIAITGGGNHTCALTSGGGVKCWGYNSTGQLGNGGIPPFSNSSTPVDVSGLSSGVTAITGGGDHTCALTTEGGVKCWGGDWVHQLGDEVYANSPIPVNVTGLSSGVSKIDAGNYHSCAVLTAGSLKCWGDNAQGQLSNGTTNLFAATPTDVVTNNTSPTAVNDEASTNEDTPVIINILANDTDAENNIVPSSVSITTAAQHGGASINTTTGAVTYTPVENYFGPDSFVYQVCDTEPLCSSATVNITVNAVNDAPVANSQPNLSTAEDTPKPITLTGSDVENSPLTFEIVTPPANGSLSGTPPAVTYTPNLNFFGDDSFTFRVSDGELTSNIATVNITVNPVNDPPVAIAQSLETAPNTPLNITLTGSDVEGATLTFAVVSPPAHGALTGTPPNLSYLPNNNYKGPDSFTFKVNDGLVDSLPATISIDVVSGNKLPIANNGSVTTDEDTQVAITLTGSDPENAEISFVVVTQPQKGTLLGTPPNLTYTPNANANGADSFTFKTNDGELDSQPGTISITITPVNDAPAANNQSVTTAEDTDLAITLTGSDVDGDALTYGVVTQPANGTLSGDAPNLTYKPNANYNGPDSFTFKVNDGALDSAAATVSITVTAVNDAPVANAQAVTTDEDTPVVITLTGSDIENSPLTFIVVTQPQHGTLSGAGASRTYTPTANYFGADSFTFKVNDGSADSAVATVTVTVNPVNDAPTAHAKSVSTSVNTPVAITLTGSDVESTALSFALTTQPQHGTLSGTPPNLTYTPVTDYSGPDSFTFTASDGSLISAPATVSITIGEVNNPPVANDQTITLGEGQPVTITLTASDEDGDPLTYTVLAQPQHGALDSNGATQVYTPAEGYNGLDSFTFRANDGKDDSNVATISLIITAENSPPVANDAAVTTAEDASVEITLSANDPEGNPLTYTIVDQPANGTLAGSGANRTYTPNANYNGADSFTFKVSDGQLDSGVATILITVESVNDAPTATGQSVSTAEDTPVQITLVAADVDGDALTYVVVTQPQHGALSGTGGTLTYTPAANYFGPDSFTFKVNDGAADSNVATVLLTVTPVNDAPVADPQSVTTPFNTPVNITLTGSDVDGDDLTFEVTVDPQHGALTGTLPTLTYTPAAGYSGADSFIFEVYDGSVLFGEATVSITVLGQSGGGGSSVDLQPGQPATLTFTDPNGGKVTIQFPAGAVNQPTTIEYEDQNAPPHAGLFQFAGRSFSLTAFRNGNPLDGLTFLQPVTLVIEYTDADVAGLDEESLMLYTYDEDAGWVGSGITVVARDPANNRLTVRITHLSDFALSVIYRQILPLVSK
jgi:VCBS repeat-containing protein